MAALVIVVVLIAAAGSGGGGSTAGRLSFGHSLQHIRARNLRLQSMVGLLTERQIRRIGGYRSQYASQPNTAPTVVSHKSEPKSVPAEASTAESECDPNYEGACLDPNASDYDCEGGSGNGPDYTGEVRVTGVDEFGLDANGDGVGCEAE